MSQERERVVTALMAAGLDRVLIDHVMDVVDEYARKRYGEGRDDEAANEDLP